MQRRDGEGKGEREGGGGGIYERGSGMSSAKRKSEIVGGIRKQVDWRRERPRACLAD